MQTGKQAQDNTISYAELAKRVGDSILANTARHALDFDDYQDFAGSSYDEETEEYNEVYQSYVITESGAEYLRARTDELVVYSEKLDLYFWEITHYGTSWTHVFTTLKD